MVHFTFTLQ